VDLLFHRLEHITKKMESIDQITALTFVGEQQIATRIDYQTCDRCGFRLMRIETTIISEQHLMVEHCSICELFDQQNLGKESVGLFPEDRLFYFDIWLGTHGLDRNTLDTHYHLKVEDFFDN
jgi:hypothetical protein